MSQSTDIIQQITKRFPSGSGAEVYKTSRGTSYTVRDWKNRRDGKYSLYYRISAKSTKSIPAEAFVWAWEKLSRGQDVTASMCLKDFYDDFGSDSCNFSVLGGVFVRLGYAEQQPGIIISAYQTA